MESYPYLARPGLNSSILHYETRNIHALPKQQTDEWLPMPSSNPFLISQECDGLQTSHNDNCSFKKYSDDPTEDLNLIEDFRVNWEMKAKVSYIWKLIRMICQDILSWYLQRSCVKLCICGTAIAGNDGKL